MVGGYLRVQGGREMSDSYKKLLQKSKYNSESAKKELLDRKSSYINTRLIGINGESIVFRYSDEVKEYKKYIDNEIFKVSNSLNVSESILLDAYSSATIEGARTTVERIKNVINNPVTKDDKMVINAIKVQKKVYEIGVSNSNIRNLWELLVSGVCENISLAGHKYRNGQVYIGNQMRIVHTPEKVDKINSKMLDLFYFYDNFKDKLVGSCVLHFYFVYIHPFCDGNGRFARLWANKLLYDKNSLFSRLVISREINNSINEYYGMLLESEYSYNNMMDITPFVEYLLQCICSAIDYASAKRYVHLSSKESLVLSKLKNNMSGATLKKLCSICNISEGSMRTILHKLESNKFISVDKSKKAYTYYIK